MNDATLAAHPDFVKRRSAPLTIVFAVLALAAVITLCLAVFNYETLLESGTVVRRGRQIEGSGAIIAPGAIVITGFFALLFTALAIFETTRWHRVSTGARLRGVELRVASDDAVAEALHQRIATGEPARYLPIPVAKKGEIWVRFYRAEADPRAFVTVQRGRGDTAKTWPLIELTERAYVQIKRRTSTQAYSQPHSG